jgi:hypothetical protein
MPIDFVHWAFGFELGVFEAITDTNIASHGVVSLII